MTPLNKLASLPDVKNFLKPVMTLPEKARAMSDNEAAEWLNKARSQLFQSINKRSRRAA